MSKMVKTYKGDLVEYEIYKLVDFYDPILRESTIPFKFESLEDNKRAHYIAFSMAETLDNLGGLGLSANQVGLKERVCAINMGNEIWTMFNPEIIDHSLVPSSYQEGCLSYPGLYLKVKRWETIRVKFQAINGEWVEKEFSGLTAVCIQHELDHLDGVLFTEKVNKIKLEQAKRKIKNNLKKMKQAALEQSVMQSKENSGIVSQKQKMKPTPVNTQDLPKITILEPASSNENSTEKFVYNVN